MTRTAYQDSVSNKDKHLKQLSSLKDLTFEICDWAVDEDVCFAIIEDWIQNSKSLRKLTLRIRLLHGNYDNTSQTLLYNVHPHPGRIRLVHKLRDLLSDSPKVEILRNNHGFMYKLLADLDMIFDQAKGEELRLTFEVDHAKLASPEG